MGEEENNKAEGKGFAGLSLLVSDVGASPTPPASERIPTGAQSGAASKAAQKVSPPTYSVPKRPSSGSSGGKWVLGIVIGVGALWLVGQSNKQPSSSSPAYAPSTQAPSYTVPSTSASPPQPQTPSRPEEIVPPVGTDLVFSMGQIRYCLAEDIRMIGAKSAVDNYSDSDVGRFNLTVGDYNSRCSSFRYRDGALESARSDIEPYRVQLQAEGRQRFASSQSPSSISTPASSALSTSAATDEQKFVEAANTSDSPGPWSRFSEDVGSRNASAPISNEEAASLEAACSTDKYVNGPAAYRACVNGQKAALAAGVRRPDLSGLSSAESQSIEAACSTDKYVNGPAAYNQCMTDQIAAMTGMGSRRPDLSQLSGPEQQSIEAACSTDKYVNGPSAYNRCLGTQLAALERQGSRPDLSGLSASDRDLLEAACSTEKYVQGPAAYNRCLSQQLARLGNQ